MLQSEKKQCSDDDLRKKIIKIRQTKHVYTGKQSYDDDLREKGDI